MNKQREAMQFALETLEDIFGKHKIDVTAINMLRNALAEPEQEPIKLRRGDRLKCRESGEYCTVWATSTTGETLVYWGGNEYGNYTAQQIGELFWIEPKQEQEPTCFKCGHAWHADECVNIAPPARKPLTNDVIMKIAKESQTAEPGLNGFILPFAFARAIERAHGIGEP